MHRFHVSQIPPAGSRAELPEAEARHAGQVLRLKVGDAVELIDGRGGAARAAVAAVGKRSVEIEVIEPLAASRESPVELTLAVSLPKGDRQRWLVEKLVELGAARLIPLIAERGVAQPTDSALARLERYVVEASKQCGRARFLEITEPAAWPALAERPAQGARRWLAHPGERAIAPPAPLTGGAVLAAVGPEGGFTEAEVECGSRAGWELVNLGPSILRIETAALAVAAWVQLAAAPADAARMP